MNPVFFVALGGLALWLVFSGNGRAAAVLQAIRFGNAQSGPQGGPNGAPPFAGPPNALPGGGGGGGFNDLIGPFTAGPDWLPTPDTSPANPGYSNYYGKPGPQGVPPYGTQYGPQDSPRFAVF